jgi:hypothetical protein
VNRSTVGKITGYGLDWQGQGFSPSLPHPERTWVPTTPHRLHGVVLKRKGNFTLYFILNSDTILFQLRFESETMEGEARRNDNN